MAVAADADPRRVKRRRSARMRAAGLHKAAADDLPFGRRRAGRGFIYLDQHGDRITEPQVIGRIKALAIPPDYRDVRIAADPQAHLQATGRDRAGRLQYRYHPDWERVREAEKIDRLAALATGIGRIRARVARDLDSAGHSRDGALAAVVSIIDQTHIRIGCEDYVQTGRSRGAATLLKRQVMVDGSHVALDFRGKSGRNIACTLDHGPLADAIRRLGGLKGPRLFQYLGSDGRPRQVTAADVNAYLAEIARTRVAANAPARVTAKDFRTLAATAAAGTRLALIDPAGSKTARRRQIAAVMREVAAMLGNTPAVAARSYVHRRLVDRFEAGGLKRLYARMRAGGRRTRAEALVDALFGQAGNGRG
ncbi:DNA topoisomerase IB (plasmid) [Tistrella bauzanensis]|uniref:DNA topoisomerase IB n=1 Tax=Tistrella TaxID=171436 RepID=UPI0031F6F92D